MVTPSGRETGPTLYRPLLTRRPAGAAGAAADRLAGAADRRRRRPRAEFLQHVAHPGGIVRPWAPRLQQILRVGGHLTEGALRRASKIAARRVRAVYRDLFRPVAAFR